MRLSTLAVGLCALIAACGGGSSPTAPTSDGSVTTGPTTTPCMAFGGREVTVARTSPVGAFTHAPFNAGDLSLITNGEETNDARFSYQWIKAGRSVPIYAPADGVLVRIRHKVDNRPPLPTDDFDVFFLVACDPANHVFGDTLVRFNHVTELRPDIKAAYAFGSLPAPTLDPFEEHEERQVPVTNIAVVAGEQLGTTTGTPFAHNFDFMVSINNRSACPFNVLDEPHRSDLLGLLGPQRNSPFGPPVPGYACQGYGGAP